MFNDSAGGFHNDSIMEESNNYTNQVSVGGTGDERVTRPLMPVSLSQIVKLTRPNEGLIIHGKKIILFTTVVQVVQVIEATPNKLHLKVRDHTNGGCVDVQLIGPDSGYIDNYEHNLQMDQQQYEAMSQRDIKPFNLLKIAPSDYIRIYGQMKNFEDKPGIVAHRIFPVNDPNEITMHILEVIAENMKAERRHNNPTVPVVPLAGGFRLSKTSNGNNSSNNHSHVSKFNLTVLNAIKNSRPKGIRTTDLYAQFGDQEQVDQAITDMQAEGLIWNGVEDDTWVSNE